MAAPTRIHVENIVGVASLVVAGVPTTTQPPTGEYVDAKAYDELQGAHYAACEALAENPAKWSFRALVWIAELILDSDYPADIFKGDGPDPDPGVAFVARLREALAALPETSPDPAGRGGGA